MSADLVLRCRAEIDRRLAKYDIRGNEWAFEAAILIRADCDAFTAILDEHPQDPDKGGDCDTCFHGTWPCNTLRAVAAALGVGDQETQP